MDIPRKPAPKTKADLLRVIEELENRLKNAETPFPTLWCNPDGFCLGANPAWFEETKTTPGSELGEGWFDLFLPEDRESLKRNWSEAIAKAEPCRFYGRALLPDGSTRRITMYGRPALSPRGTVLRYFGILNEISKPLSSDATASFAPSDPVDALRILVAEDNHTNRQIIQHMLIRLGHRVEVVENGFEALKVLEHQPFDVFFVDVQMPEMDGLETTRVIRRKVAHVVNPDMQIIAVTAFTHPETRIKCKEAGMDDFLPKPISLENIRGALLRARGKHGPQAPLPITPATDAPLLPPNAVEDSEKEIIFDRHGFLTRLNGNEGALKEIIEVFMKNAPEKIRALKDLLKTRTRETLALQAHSLAGAAANIGAERLRKLAKQLELAAEEENFSNAESIITKISDEFALFQSAVREC